MIASRAGIARCAGREECRDAVAAQHALRCGIRRVRRGKGFACVDENGVAVTDPEATQRIDDPVIPPAWRKVWI
ncbi:hypothetical protein [Nocardia nova]|uniref:hypothetical protein n=1 Tax=Nocardia TaxID=1817 RepID=UPI0007E9650C|nr:hypothetical protein [Nocardia nova]OBA49449.1 hypothetical protein A5789_31600 [Nocardia sp. 852002-51101_SCH5132738]OBB46153.1 hypothetical protein A5748_24420 [Nocardia sp. 852002-51244_SCH5132740]OBF66515.1 hypothetical protein A9X06_06015 [Mycobacterium sp. 852002-51759_SCH5129042]